MPRQLATSETDWPCRTTGLTYCIELAGTTHAIIVRWTLATPFWVSTFAGQDRHVGADRQLARTLPDALPRGPRGGCGGVRRTPGRTRAGRRLGCRSLHRHVALRVAPVGDGGRVRW